jgi:uncharacterized Fe-S radical SAM superfamily protein PflX
VIHLAQVLQAHTSSSGCHIYTDKFYTSPQLAQELHEMKIHITGRVMASRKDFPSDLKKKKLQECELCAYQCDMKNKSELGSMLLAEKLDWKGLNSEDNVH